MVLPGRMRSLLVFLVSTLHFAQCVLATEVHRPKLGTQACLSGLAKEYLCTMQLHSNNSGLDILDNLNNSQRNWRSTPTGTIRVNFTVDPLLQTRYLGPGWQLQPWLPEAPSVFPDQELVVSTATGGFLSGKQVKTTGYIDYFWCSDSTCEAVLDLAYLHNNWTGTCDFGVALAALPHSVAGFGLPHSIGTPPLEAYTLRLPPQAGTGVEGALRCNNLLGNPQARGFVQGSIHVVPTRSAAQFVDRDRSALVGVVGHYEHLNACTTFILPNSEWYASKQFFREWKTCSESSNTVMFLGLAGSPWGYNFPGSVFDTKGLGDMPYVSTWPTLGVPCERLFASWDFYSTCYYSDFPCAHILAPVRGEDSGICRADFSGPGCFLLVNTTSVAHENFTLWGVNITSTSRSPFPFGLDGGAPDSLYPAKFNWVFASAFAEATVFPRPFSCLKNSTYWDVVPHIDYNTYGANASSFAAFGKCFTLGAMPSRDQCSIADPSNFRGSLGPWAFMRDFTRTIWLTNHSTSPFKTADGDQNGVWSEGGVHGFGPVNMAAVGVALSVLGSSVQSELLSASSAALSNVDSTLKWPGALIVLVISVIASIGAVYQGRDLWDSMNRRSWRYWVMLLVITLVVGVGALLPVGFAAAGELTTYANNKQINGISYLQLAVDMPDYAAVSAKGNQKLVALVAVKTNYESSIVIPGVLYSLTVLFVVAMLAYSCWRWFSPSKCAVLALGTAAHSQLQTLPLLSPTVPTAPTAVAGSSAPAAAARSQGSKRSSSLSKHKSGSLGVELPQQHAVPAGVSTPQQVARTVSAPQQASGGDRAPRALSQRHRVLTM